METLDLDVDQQALVSSSESFLASTTEADPNALPISFIENQLDESISSADLATPAEIFSSTEVHEATRSPVIDQNLPLPASTEGGLYQFHFKVQI